MRSRRKALIIAAVVLFALLFIGVGALLVQWYMAFYSAETALKDTRGRLEFLYGRNPFPSEQNLGIERGNLKTAEKELADLLGAMSRGQVETLEQSPAKFEAQYWEIRGNMLAKAETAGITVVGKNDIDFGFRRPFKGDLPSPKDVSRLTQQLRIVENLVDVLCTARIAELRGIGREEFEVESITGAAGRPSDDASTGRHRRATESPGTTVLNTVDAEAGIVPEGQMFGTWHFAFSFTANESALIRVLDGFARNPLFTVVTKMELVGDSKMSAKAPEATTRPVSGAKGAEAAAIPVPATEASRDLRIVCGRDTPVSVKMEVDVFQFAKPAGAPARAEGAP